MDVGYLPRAVEAYAESLTKLEQLPPDTFVLPGEGRPFRGLHQRIQQIVQARAARTAAVAHTAKSANSAAHTHGQLTVANITDKITGCHHQAAGSFARFAALMDTAAHMYAAGIPVSGLPSWHSR